MKGLSEMRGRPPKPIAILKQQGTYDASRHAKRGAEPSSNSMVAMPDDLSGDAADFWLVTIPKLEVMGILDGIDVAELEALCRWWAAWRLAMDKLEAIQAGNREGNSYSAMTEAAQAWKAFDRIASQFGFTPTQRTRLAIEKPNAEPDPFERWLAQKNSQSQG